MSPEETHARKLAGLAKGRAAREAKRAARLAAQIEAQDADGAATAQSAPDAKSDAPLVQLRSDPDLAHAAAMAQGSFLQRDVAEVPTGRRIAMQKAVGYKVVGHHDDGREIIKPVFKTENVPTFYYKVDLPPCGGSDLKLNGTPYYHGGVYELDLDTLRTVKDMVYRMWKHDAEIHGSDENFYRKPTRVNLSARGGR